MVRFRQDPIEKNYTDGKKAVRFLEDGSGMVFYKSGRIAITVTSTDLGFIQQAFADNRHGSVLMNFDELGVGSASFPPPKGGTTGHPRYVCELSGGKFCTEEGDIARAWPWEAPIGSSWTPDIPEEWTFALNQHLTFSATSRQDMRLTFHCDNVTMNFEVGEIRKRKDGNYMETQYFAGRVRDGPSRGKVILTVPKTIDSYRSSGDAARLSESGEVAELTATMGSMDLSKTLDQCHTWTKSAKAGKHAVMPFVEPAAMNALRSTVANPNASLGDEIEPDRHHECGGGHNITAQGPQPATMQAFNDGAVLGMGDYHGSTKLDRSFSLNSGRYKQPLHSRPTTRKKLQLIKTKNFDHFISKVVPPTQLVLVAVLESYTAASRQTEGMLETKWGELTAGAGTRSKLGASATAEEIEAAKPSVDKLPVRIVRFEHSESRLLIDRFNFHATPMFLMYYGGMLVFASGTLGRDGITPKDLDSAIEHALQEAAKQNFLPDDFQFGLKAGQTIDQGDGHAMLMQRSTELGDMLDAGRSRRLKKDRN